MDESGGVTPSSSVLSLNQEEVCHSVFNQSFPSSMASLLISIFVTFFGVITLKTVKDYRRIKPELKVAIEK